MFLRNKLFGFVHICFWRGYLEDVDIAESGFLNEITGLFNRFIRWG